MMESVIGLLADRESAQRVRIALVEAGCDQSAVVIFERDAGQALAGELVERGLEQARAELYTKAVLQGGVLVAAEAATAERALAVMNRFALTSPEDLLGRAGETVERAQSVEEELHVGKQAMAGGKRLVTSVTEREVEKPVTLHEETIEVERRREDHALRPEEAARAFREETVELTATSERPVVSKEARVTGEVALRKRSVERREVVRDTVRRQDVDVETIVEVPKVSPER
ncbi:YsnF/AvaK domain-containing protein [Dankookia sp. GCM10030260]|uniref:YsnF/AvaK domain-containing protein n=1 Tax=Dankookia sp. GCM10030260 TaxID=3273390 RepID=UPI003623E120